MNRRTLADRVMRAIRRICWLFIFACASSSFETATAQPQTSHVGWTWEGTIYVRHTWADVGVEGVKRAEIRLRLQETDERFRYDSRNRPSVSVTKLVHLQSEISESFKGKTWPPGKPGDPCEGKGQGTMSGSPAGSIWRNLSGADVSGEAGFPLPPEGAYSINLMESLADQSYPITCASGLKRDRFGFLSYLFIGRDVRGYPDWRLEEGGTRMRGTYSSNLNNNQYEVTWDLRGRPPTEVPKEVKDPESAAGGPGQTADISIEARPDRHSMDVGAEFTLSFVVTNRGPGAAVDTLVLLIPPPGTSLQGVGSSAGDCNPQPPIQCSLGTMNRGASATITARLTPTVGGALNLTANALSVTPDPDWTNNSAGLVVQVAGKNR